MLNVIRPSGPEYFRLDNFQVFNCLVEGRFYGFPVFGVHSFKFGKYHHFEEQRRVDDKNTRRATRTRRCSASLRPATSHMPPARR